MLLAIDTSTRQAGAALYDSDRGVLAEYNWHSANRHTQELIPAIDLLLGSAGATITDLKAIGVALGPGSFSGLRVGLAAAKGLALARGIPLLGIPTLDATAYPHRRRVEPLVAVAQAGRGRLYYARYERGQPGLSEPSVPQLGDIASIAEATHHPTMFVGELSSADCRALIDRLTDAAALFLPPALSMRRAGYFAELAWARFAAGEGDDVASLSPLYLQQPQGAKPEGLPGVSGS